jgi:hypothetical protein
MRNSAESRSPTQTRSHISSKREVRHKRNAA